MILAVVLHDMYLYSGVLLSRQGNCAKHNCEIQLLWVIVTGDDNSNKACFRRKTKFVRESGHLAIFLGNMT